VNVHHCPVGDTVTPARVAADHLEVTTSLPLLFLLRRKPRPQKCHRPLLGMGTWTRPPLFVQERGHHNDGHDSRSEYEIVEMRSANQPLILFQIGSNGIKLFAPTCPSRSADPGPPAYRTQRTWPAWTSGGLTEDGSARAE
jgi:hypothetical protein